VLLATLLALTLLGAQEEDVVILTNGDRISGRVASKGRRTLRLQTPHGVLTINLDKIERVKRADGTEELMKAPPPTPAPTPAPRSLPPVQLALAITGKTFWQAWDAQSPPDDPTLRLELRIDDRMVASWLDATLEEGEIPKAIVNSFSFTPDALRVAAAPEVKALSPELQAGRIQLVLDLQHELQGPRQLRLAYQSNAGSALAPEWRDLVSVEAAVMLHAGARNAFRVEQGRGRMEFSKRSMKNVNTFELGLKLDTPASEP
jgi:hypothetical protein